MGEINRQLTCMKRCTVWLAKRKVQITAVSREPIMFAESLPVLSRGEVVENGDSSARAGIEVWVLKRHSWMSAATGSIPGVARLCASFPEVGARNPVSDQSHLFKSVLSSLMFSGDHLDLGSTFSPL